MDPFLKTAVVGKDNTPVASSVNTLSPTLTASGNRLLSSDDTSRTSSAENSLDHQLVSSVSPLTKTNQRGAVGAAVAEILGRQSPSIESSRTSPTNRDRTRPNALEAAADTIQAQNSKSQSPLTTIVPSRTSPSSDTKRARSEPDLQQIDAVQRDLSVIRRQLNGLQQLIGKSLTKKDEDDVTVQDDIISLRQDLHKAIERYEQLTSTNTNVLKKDIKSLKEFIQTLFAQEQELEKQITESKLEKSTGKKPKTTSAPPPPPAIYAFPIDPRNPSSNLNVPYTPLPTGYSQQLFGKSKAAFPVEEDSGDDDIDVGNEDQIYKSYSFADSSSSQLSVPYVPLPVGFSLQAGGTSSSATLTASDETQTSTSVYQLPFDSTLSVPYVPLPVGNNLELNGNSTNAIVQSSDETQTSTSVYQLPFDSTLSVPYVPLPVGNNLELNGNSTNATVQSSDETQTSTSVYQLPFDSTLSVPYVPLPVGNNLELTGNSTNATVQSSDESKVITNVYQLPFDSTLIVPYMPLPVGNYLLLSSSDTYIPTLNFDNVKTENTGRIRA